jgi:hypothetical protein
VKRESYSKRNNFSLRRKKVAAQTANFKSRDPLNVGPVVNDSEGQGKGQGIVIANGKVMYLRTLPSGTLDMARNDAQPKNSEWHANAAIAATDTTN